MTVDLDDLARDAVTTPPTSIPELRDLRARVKQRRRNKQLITTALLSPLIALAALSAYAVPDRDDTPDKVATARAPEPTPTSVPASEEPGRFLWPTPTRNLSTATELTEQFISEVLAWEPNQYRQEGNIEDGKLTITNLDTNRVLSLGALRLDEGWGLFHIGYPSTRVGDTDVFSDGGMALERTPNGHWAVSFEPPSGTAITTVEVRYVNGETTTDTTTGSELPLPADRPMESVTSTLVTHATSSGTVIMVEAGYFNHPGPTAPYSTDSDGTAAQPNGIDPAGDQPAATIDSPESATRDQINDAANAATDVIDPPRIDEERQPKQQTQRPSADELLVAARTVLDEPAYFGEEPLRWSDKNLISVHGFSSGIHIHLSPIELFERTGSDVVQTLESIDQHPTTARCNGLFFLTISGPSEVELPAIRSDMLTALCR